MRTVKLTIAYDGTYYKGWQIQKNGKTVQETVEKSIEKVFGGHHRLYGASRTDSGVHAKAQVAHFKTPLDLPASKIPAALNSVLPSDIAVTKASYEKDNFHAQYDAKSKKYTYLILNSRNRDPFRERNAARVPYKLDISLMKKEAKVLLGRHDFKSFQAKDKKERSSARTIKSLKITKKGEVVFLEIEADGFLYNMVRNIAGTLIDIGRGHLPPGSMRRILASRNRSSAGPTAPSKALTLINIKY